VGSGLYELLQYLAELHRHNYGITAASQQHHSSIIATSQRHHSSITAAS
jgi:hypothetical protein